LRQPYDTLNSDTYQQMTAHSLIQIGRPCSSNFPLA
jgi:hypothetical protein